MSAHALDCLPAATSPGRRVLIVNADDFGRSLGINRGVLEAYDHGIVTSASLMTLWPASAAAARESERRPGLGIGLHVDLGEWLFRGGAWSCTYLRVPLADRDAVESEVARQLQAFRRLLGRNPTHLDSHQHVHLGQPVAGVLRELAAELGVPLRHTADDVRYCGDFFGQTGQGERLEQAVGVDALLRTLELLEPGVTELGCHPGYATDLATAYRRERELEVRTLCDARVRAGVVEQGVALRSFAIR
jgi:chitin disaccharide deacetylase